MHGSGCRKEWELRPRDGRNGSAHRAAVSCSRQRQTVAKDGSKQKERTRCHPDNSKQSSQRDAKFTPMFAQDDHQRQRNRSPRRCDEDRRTSPPRKLNRRKMNQIEGHVHCVHNCEDDRSRMRSPESFAIDTKDFISEEDKKHEIPNTHWQGTRVPSAKHPADLVAFSSRKRIHQWRLENTVGSKPNEEDWYSELDRCGQSCCSHTIGMHPSHDDETALIDKYDTECRESKSRAALDPYPSFKNLCAFAMGPRVI
jgi:hypothetical protein